MAQMGPSLAKTLRMLLAVLILTAARTRHVHQARGASSTSPENGRAFITGRARPVGVPIASPRSVAPVSRCLGESPPSAQNGDRAMCVELRADPASPSQRAACWSRWGRRSGFRDPYPAVPGVLARKAGGFCCQL